MDYLENPCAYRILSSRKIPLFSRLPNRGYCSWGSIYLANQTPAEETKALHGGRATERFLSTYEYVVMAYGYDDYIGRGIVPSQNHASASNSMAIPLLCIFFIALLGGGTVLVIIKRKRAR